jgi:GxxExxY protein
MEFDELSNKVIGCAIEVHKQLGPGLLESSYERCCLMSCFVPGCNTKLRRNSRLITRG